MQLCQIHFYQKIARKKVARVNAALHQQVHRKMAKYFPKTKEIIMTSI